MTDRKRPADRRDQILDAAEKLARERGYHGFSFRDVAEAVGIKSASVHHHFPAKADLARVLAERYRERFMASLGDPQAPDALERLIAGYRSALGPRHGMCLCGLFGAERDGLPEAVAAEVAAFFKANLDFANAAIGTGDGRAEALLGGLEGALIAARSLGDPAVFERAATALTALAGR